MGIVDFRERMLPQYERRFEALALSQAPDALFVTCSDSCVVPDLLASTEPGDLFTMRNVGNLVPPATAEGVSIGDLSEASASTIMLLMAIEAKFPDKRQLHIFLDNARYHHAKLVQAWLARPGCRIRLHFVPAYCPHLNPIERPWGLLHRHITHNKCHATFKDFSIAMLSFLRDDVPKNWRTYCDQVTDNFRVMNPTEFRIMG